MMPLRLAFLTTHPIQYQIPIFRRLARERGLEFTVLFVMLPDDQQQGEGFGVRFQWDVPLLEGYRYEVLENVSRAPAVTTFRGCDTPAIGEVIRRLRLDALVVNGWGVKSCLQGLRACRRLQVPCVVRGEANLRRPRPWWKHAMHRLLVRQYSACLYIGQANREFYEFHGVAPTKLFPALYCVENTRLAASAMAWNQRRPGLRDAFGVPWASVCFLFSGKLEAKKHPLALVRAFREVVGRVTGVHLLVVGDGALRAACEQYVVEHRLPVSFAGFLNQSRMPEAYAAADCLVLPSDHGETWGLVVNEAMACGLPAIVSDEVGCAADLIVERATGRTFQSGRWDQLVECMLDMVEASPLLPSMGEAARRQVAGYSAEAAADGIVQAARSVAAPAIPQAVIGQTPQ
jgi:glycosyltransferase involved in cell wall biosynthesis